MRKGNTKTPHYENSLNFKLLFYRQLLFLIAFIKYFILLWQGISPFCYAFFKKIDVHFLKTETHIIAVLTYRTLQKNV